MQYIIFKEIFQFLLRLHYRLLLPGSYFDSWKMLSRLIYAIYPSFCSSSPEKEKYPYSKSPSPPSFFFSSDCSHNWIENKRLEWLPFTHFYVTNIAKGTFQHLSFLLGCSLLSATGLNAHFVHLYPHPLVPCIMSSILAG